jgi:uncharacterized protein
MTLLEQLTNDYKEALKARDDVKKSVLNFVLAQAKNKKIELQKDLEDTEVMSLLKKEIKAISETIGYLEKAEKLEDIEIEKQKKVILEAYLPATMNKEQTTDLIKKLMAEHNIADLKTQRGLLMKELMANYKSEIDAGLVNEIINEMVA